MEGLFFAMTLASIITPAFNAMAFLPACVASVQAQSIRDWELIFIDDGSTDGTAAWLDALDDPRIRVIHQANGGASAARNTALGMARGEFVTFLDADDALTPRSIECRVERFRREPRVDIVDGAVRVCDSDLGAVLRHRRVGREGEFLPRLLRLDEGAFFNVMYVVRREAIGDLRFRTDMTHCEDILFFAELADRCLSRSGRFQFGAVDEDVYLYRKADGSAMSNMAGLQQGYFQLLERCRLLAHANPDDLDAMRRRIRRILFRSWLRRGRPLRALQCAWRLGLR